MRVAILAVQGAFIEHRKKLESLGAECIELRKKEDLEQSFYGLILLAEHLSNDEHVYFGTLPVTVRRNVYGRQLGSFHTDVEVKGIGEAPMTFIRVLYIEAADDQVQMLARVDDRIVAVQYGAQIGLSFHPELDADNQIHEKFLELIADRIAGHSL